mgnify:CR=1 FL=1
MHLRRFNDEELRQLHADFVRFVEANWKPIHPTIKVPPFDSASTDIGQEAMAITLQGMTSTNCGEGRMLRAQFRGSDLSMEIGGVTKVTAVLPIRIAEEYDDATSTIPVPGMSSINSRPSTEYAMFLTCLGILLAAFISYRHTTGVAWN